MKLFFIIFYLIPVTSFSYVINVTLSWNMNNDYNVQESSIIQLIAFNHNNSSYPTDYAEDNFEMNDGSYNPLTSPEGHDIVYQSNISYENNRLFFETSYILLGDYDRVYVRIFESTNFNEVELSHWGLTSVSRITGAGRASIIERNFDLDNTNYFSIDQPFEVIDEPVTIKLFFIGICILFLRPMIKAL